MKKYKEHTFLKDIIQVEMFLSIELIMSLMDKIMSQIGTIQAANEKYNITDKGWLRQHQELYKSLQDALYDYHENNKLNK